MNDTMKALVLEDFNRMVVVEMARPEPAPDEVQIAVTATGICGSDIHGYTGENGRRVPGQVMGHESEGIVAATGVDVDATAFPEGARVTFNPVVLPPSAQQEFLGREQHCPAKYVIGVRPDRPAAFAEYIVVPARNVVCLPESIPAGYGALVEPLAVAIHAVRRAGVAAGDAVLVIGGGPIGQSVVLALALMGVHRIVVSEPAPGRRELLRQLGAQVVDPGSVDLGDHVVERLGGPADVVIDAVGATSTLHDSLASVKLGGTVCLVGMGATLLTLNAFLVSTGERSVVGSFTYSAQDFKDAAAWIASSPPTAEHLITRQVSIHDAPGEFAQLSKGEGTSGKVLVCFSG